MNGIPIRNLNVALLTLVGISLIGFVVGVGPDAEYDRLVIGGDDVPDLAHGNLDGVRTYKELREQPWREAGTWDSTRAALEVPLEARVDKQEPVESALARRAQRRAYDGAPPVVPHPVGQRDEPSCLACHAEALQLKAGHTASTMSHTELRSCVQCHAVGVSPVPIARDDPLRASEKDWAKNLFEGAKAPTGGARAYEIAPPVIPHSRHMRDDCLSCHGPSGALPMRSSHPERQSCVQCHAAQADDEQRASDGLKGYPF